MNRTEKLRKIRKEKARNLYLRRRHIRQMIEQFERDNRHEEVAELRKKIISINSRINAIESTL